MSNAQAGSVVFQSLDIGQTCRTRAGDTVTIRDFDQESHRFFGDILDPDGSHVRIASFSSAGKYGVTGGESQFDIVEILSKEAP